MYTVCVMSSFILSGSSLMKNVLAPFIKFGVQNLMSFGGIEKWKWFQLSWNWKRRFCTGLINYYHLSEGFFKTSTFILTVMAIILCCVQRNLRSSRTHWTRTFGGVEKWKWFLLRWNCKRRFCTGFNKLLSSFWRVL